MGRGAGSGKEWRACAMSNNDPAQAHRVAACGAVVKWDLEADEASNRCGGVDLCVVLGGGTERPREKGPLCGPGTAGGQSAFCRTAPAQTCPKFPSAWP